MYLYEEKSFHCKSDSDLHLILAGKVGGKKKKKRKVDNLLNTSIIKEEGKKEWVKMLISHTDLPIVLMVSSSVDLRENSK